MKRRIEDVQDVFLKQSARDGLRQEIYNLLYDEKTGLPASKYDNSTLEVKTDALFQFFESRQTSSVASWA